MSLLYDDVFLGAKSYRILKTWRILSLSFVSFNFSFGFIYYTTYPSSGYDYTWEAIFNSRCNSCPLMHGRVILGLINMPLFYEKRVTDKWVIYKKITYLLSLK